MPPRRQIQLPSMRDQFRFWGHTDPRGRRKPTMLVEAATDGAEATIRLYDVIDSWGDDWGISAREFASVLDQIGDASQINLRINSPGGEVFEAVAIMNQLRSHSARVVATVDGVAASAASFIAASADEVIMGRNSEMMIHDGAGLVLGNAADMREMADLLDHLSDNIASVYADKGGGDVAAWRALMVAETWFTADEAVTAGLADRVDRPVTDAPDEAAKNRYDLGALFQHAGRADAPPPKMPADEPVEDFEARHARNRHKMNAARHGLTV